VLTAWAPNFTILLIARALVGLMLYASAMNASALVSGLVGPAQRGRALMILGFAQIAGMSAAFALGGKLAALFGSGPNGWRWAMLWLTLPLAAVLLLTLWIREPPRSGAVALRASLRSSFVALWRYRAMMLPLSFGPVIVGMGYSAALVWSAPPLAQFQAPARSGWFDHGNRTADQWCSRPVAGRTAGRFMPTLRWSATYHDSHDWTRAFTDSLRFFRCHAQRFPHECAARCAVDDLLHEGNHMHDNFHSRYTGRASGTVLWRAECNRLGVCELVAGAGESTIQQHGWA
jgi:hypothetical protein